MTLQEKQYIASFSRIGRMKETERLYVLEEQRNQKIIECAEEWQKLQKNVNKIETDFWTRAIPQAIFDLLTSWDKKAVKEAIREYQECERMGLL